MHFFWVLVITAFVVWTDPAFAHKDPEIAGYIQVDGGRIWYRLNGSEHLGKKPAIIVAHGGPGGTHRGNLPYVKLADSYPVILYDQLGTGNSDRTGNPDNWKTEKFVAEIDYIRRALGLDEVVVAGHSWGGTLAAEYAVRRPKGLKATILSSPLISTEQWNEDNARWVAQLPEDVQRTLKKNEAAGTLDDPSYAKAVSMFYKRHMCRKDPCPGGSYRAGGPDWNEKMYLHMWGPTDFRGIGTLKDYDLTPKLPKISVPTLVICGEFDEAAPESCARYARMIKGAQNTTVPDAGHATMAEDEVYYLAAVRGFIAAALRPELAENR